MLPERQKINPRKQGPAKANINHGRSNRTPQAYHSKDRSFHENDRSFHENDRTNGGDKSFLPSIGNSRQIDSSRPIQNYEQRKNYHSHNHSVADRNAITSEKKTSTLHVYSHNNSIERPLQKKLYDDNTSFELEYPEEPMILEQNDISYYPGFEMPQDRSLTRPANKTSDESFHRIIADLSPTDHKEAKKAYGQYLLEQMKAKESKKNFEKLQRQEEDRQMLNQNNFFDGFGRSRDKFLQKYRSNLLQPLGVTREDNKQKMPPLAFDKIHNHSRNYNLYHPTLNEGLDLSPNHQSVSPMRSIINHPSEKAYNQNSALNRTLEPHYHNNLLYPPEVNETDLAELSGELEYNINNQSKLLEPQGKYANGLKPSESQNPNNHLRQKSSVGELSWKPSTDKLTNENENLKNYISKLEYQKILDQQVFEKQLQKAHEQKVQELEDMIENMRIDRERIMKELEENSRTPKTKPAYKLFEQSQSLSPTNRNNFDNIKISFGKNSKHKNSHGVGGGGGGLGGGGAPIILQPGDFGTKPNRSILGNHSSKRTLHDNNLSSRRDLNDQFGYQDDAFKDERGRNIKFQDQFLDVKNHFQKPTDFSRPPKIKESESKRSLANETRFVPIDPYHASKIERLLPPNYQNRSPLHETSNYQNEKHFSHPKIIHNDLTLRSPIPQDPNDRIGFNLDRLSIDRLANLASSLENSVKNQNQELKKEIKELKDQIAKLTEGKGNNTDYDSIHMRLNRIKDEGEDTQSTQPTNFQLQYSGNKNSSYVKANPNRSFDSQTIEPRAQAQSFIEYNSEIDRIRQLNARGPRSLKLKKRIRGVKRHTRTGEEELQKKF